MALLKSTVISLTNSQAKEIGFSSRLNLSDSLTIRILDDLMLKTPYYALQNCSL